MGSLPSWWPCPPCRAMFRGRTRCKPTSISRNSKNRYAIRLVRGRYGAQTNRAGRQRHGMPHMQYYKTRHPRWKRDCLLLQRSRGRYVKMGEGKEHWLKMWQITYDLHQLPTDALTPLRDSLLQLLQLYSSGPRPIRTQLCVCTASLAIQMTSWKNVLGTVGSAVGNSSDGGDCMLDFLRILPEEVTEGRKINISVRSIAQHPMLGFSAFAPSQRNAV